MELKSVLLDNNLYQEFLAGKEIECPSNKFNNKNVREGEHILVYKDTLAAATDVGTPTREKQSEYIGVEGAITSISPSGDPLDQDREHLLRLRKI